MVSRAEDLWHSATGGERSSRAGRAIKELRERSKILKGGKRGCQIASRQDRDSLQARDRKPERPLPARGQGPRALPHRAGSDQISAARDRTLAPTERAAAKLAS